MATIIQIPGALSIAGNIADIILDSADPVNFKILLGAETLLDENYDPDADEKITIRLRDVLPSLLSVAIPTSNVFEQTGAAKTFTFNIGGVTSSHVVVAGGVNAVTDPNIFLRANWLTWQLQQKRVKYLDPEWLSYYAAVAVTVKLKAYFKEGDPETIDLTSLASGKMYSLNLNFQYISGLFVGQPVYFDVWTEDAGNVRLSFIQRYVLQNDSYESEDIFVFENSIGGIDTIRFTGEKTEDNKFEISSALFDEDTKDYDIDFSQVFTKSAGYFSSERERQWSNEFFNSAQRYLSSSDGLKLVTVSAPMARVVSGDNSTIDYEFKFALSRQTKYLNLARVETLPEDVEIIDPDTEVFFLAPRLSEFPTATLEDLLLFPVQMPFTEEWRQLPYSAIKEDLLQEFASVLSAGLSEKADLVAGKVPLEQLPNMSATLTDILEVINEGTEDAYLNIKLPTAFNYGVQVYSDNGQFPPSVWANMPYATDAAIGGIIYDSVIFEKNVSNQLTIKSGVLVPAAHNHDDRYFTESEVNATFATNARVDGIEAIMSTDTERLAAVNALTSSYSAADTALNDTLTAALVYKAPLDNPTFTGTATAPVLKATSYIQLVGSDARNYYLQTGTGYIELYDGTGRIKLTSGNVSLTGNLTTGGIITRGSSGTNGVGDTPSWTEWLSAYENDSTHASKILTGNSGLGDHGTWMKFQINLTDAPNNPFDAIVINHHGNVGIGTTNPLAPVHAVNTSNISWSTTGNAAGHLIVGKKEDSGLAIGSVRGTGTTGYTWMQAGILDAMQYDNDIVLQPKGGNVGIKKTDPQAELDVNGNGIVRGSLMVYSS